MPKRPWVMRLSVLLDLLLPARDLTSGRNETQLAATVETQESGRDDSGKHRPQCDRSARAVSTRHGTYG